MADERMQNRRADCARRALRQFGAQITRVQLLQAYAAEKLLPAQMQKNMDCGMLPEMADYGVVKGNAPDVLEMAPVWAALHAEDAARAMQMARMDVSIDHDAQSAECVGFLAAAMVYAHQGRDAVQALADAAEMLPEECRCAHLLLDARQLTQQDADGAAQRMNWRYGSQRPTALSRLAALVMGVLCKSDAQDALAEQLTAQEAPDMEPIAQQAAEAAEEKAADQRIEVTLMGPPTLAPGKARQCLMKVENNGARPLFGPVRTEVQGCLTAMTVPYAKVMPGKSESIPLTVWLPEETEILSESNTVSVRFSGLRLRFGITGAQGWRVRGCRDGEEWSAWEAHFNGGDRIRLDSLSGWQGPCQLEMQRTLVVREEMRAQICIAHTCAFVLEIDGVCAAQAEASDGWTADEVQCDVTLTPGEHDLHLHLQRRMPGAWIQMDWKQDGAWLPVEDVNPLKGL